MIEITNLYVHLHVKWQLLLQYWYDNYIIVCLFVSLVPRPSVYAYLSPIHVNVHQQLFLWLAEFVHGVVRTINLSLFLSASTEGKMFMEEIKAKREMVQQLPGIDAKCYIPYTKVRPCT